MANGLSKLEEQSAICLAKNRGVPLQTMRRRIIEAHYAVNKLLRKEEDFQTRLVVSSMFVKGQITLSRKERERKNRKCHA